MYAPDKRHQASLNRGGVFVHLVAPPFNFFGKHLFKSFFQHLYESFFFQTFQIVPTLVPTLLVTHKYPLYPPAEALLHPQCVDDPGAHVAEVEPGARG